MNLTDPYDEDLEDEWDLLLDFDLDDFDEVEQLTEEEDL